MIKKGVEKGAEKLVKDVAKKFTLPSDVPKPKFSHFISLPMQAKDIKYSVYKKMVGFCKLYQFIVIGNVLQDERVGGASGVALPED